MFLLIHIGLSIATIIGLFYHTAIFDGQYNGYLWPVVAVWSCDRFLRIVRQFCCNLHVSLSGKVQGTKLTASYDQEMDMIRLEVVRGGKFLTLKPNQDYFLSACQVEGVGESSFHAFWLEFCIDTNNKRQRYNHNRSQSRRFEARCRHAETAICLLRQRLKPPKFTRRAKANFSHPSLQCVD